MKNLKKLKIMLIVCLSIFSCNALSAVNFHDKATLFINEKPQEDEYINTVDMLSMLLERFQNVNLEISDKKSFDINVHKYQQKDLDSLKEIIQYQLMYIKLLEMLSQYKDGVLYQETELRKYRNTVFIDLPGYEEKLEQVYYALMVTHNALFLKTNYKAYIFEPRLYNMLSENDNESIKNIIYSDLSFSDGDILLLMESIGPSILYGSRVFSVKYIDRNIVGMNQGLFRYILRAYDVEDISKSMSRIGLVLEQNYQKMIDQNSVLFKSSQKREDLYLSFIDQID